MGSTCYRKLNSTISEETAGHPRTKTDGPRPCCNGADSYLSHDICLTDKPTRGGSGYYLAGCTDKSYKAAACAASLGQSDIIYNSGNQLWYCCGGTAGNASCGSPSEFTFFAPAPVQLPKKPVTSVSITRTPTATTPPSGSITEPGGAPTSSDSPSTVPEPSGSSLSGGAIAGIVIGAVLFVVLVASLISLKMRSKRRAMREASLPYKVENIDNVEVYIPGQTGGEHQHEPDQYMLEDQNKQNNQNTETSLPSELPSENTPLRLDTTLHRMELDADSPAVHNRPTSR